MMSVDEALKELARLEREMSLVKKSLASSEVKQRLLEQLQARVAAVSLKTEPGAKSGKVGA